MLKRGRYLKRAGSLLIVLVLLPGLANAVLQKQFSFVAKWGSAMPGNVSSMFLNFSSPVINPQMTAFFARGSNNYQAIFTTLPGFLKAQVSNDRQLPLSSGTIRNFVGSASEETTAESSRHQLSLSISQNSIAFMATDREMNQGIYRVDPQSLHAIATQKIPVPKSKGNFTKLGSPKLINSQCVGFWGEGSQDQGIYLSNSKKHLKPLVTAGDTLGQKQLKIKRLGDFDFGYRPQKCDMKSLNYAFVAYDKRNDPVLYQAQSKGDHYKNLVDSSQSIPGDYIGFFTKINHLSYDKKKNRIAFVGYGVIDQQGLFLIDQGKLKPFVTQDTLLPKSPGSFETFKHVNLRGHNVVFEATGSHEVQGVYLANMEGDQFKILNNQDKLNGKKIHSVKISNQAFIGKRVVMLVTFENGQKGILTATLQSKAF